MQTIGVFFGSQSPEHDISIITGEFVIAELKKIGYAVVPIYINKKGEWHISETVGSLKFFTAGDSEQELSRNNFHKFYLDLEQSRGKIVLKRKGLAGKEIIIDVAFPALHGSFGEDGTIQGLFEMFGVPYVGCDVAASAIAMDKILTKDIYKAHGIKTTPYFSFSAWQWEHNKTPILQYIRKNLSPSVFVKPSRLGSSIGIGKVADTQTTDLEFKIEVALQYCSTVLVEDAVHNLVDLTCCILGSEEPIASLVQQSVFAADLFDFNEKYLHDGGAQLGNAKSGLKIPAQIPADVTTTIQETSKEIFGIIGASGIARVDWLYDSQSGALCANEINTIPGTLYHHLWKASGVEISAVLKQLVAIALERSEKAKSRVLTFSSPVLREAGSLKLGNKI